MAYCHDNDGCIVLGVEVSFLNERKESQSESMICC